MPHLYTTCQNAQSATDIDNSLNKKCTALLVLIHFAFAQLFNANTATRTKGLGVEPLATRSWSQDLSCSFSALT